MKKPASRIALALAVTSIVALATAVPTTAQAAPRATTQATPALHPMAIGAMQIADGAFAAFVKAKACIDNMKVDQPCLASDSKNIRAILERLAAFEQKVQANHEETIARFNVLENTLNSGILHTYINNLKELESNGENAMKAYLALSDCLVAATSTDATCQAYIGGSGVEAPQPVAQATAETKAYFLKQVAFMGSNIDSRVADFAGTSAGHGNNGLAAAAWKLSKRLQEQQLGVTNSAVVNAGTTTVVTKETADTVNQYLEYYQELFDRYGFLLVTAAGMNGADDLSAARSMQATVDNKILGERDRYQLRGAAHYFRMPHMQDGEITVAPAGKPMIIGSHPGLGRDLTSTDIADLASVLNHYSKTETIAAAVPTAFPTDRLYTAKAHVSHFKKELYTCLFLTGCQWTQMVDSHALSDSKDPQCWVQMRPMNSKPAWNKDAETDMRADPSMPNNYFKHVHETYVHGAVDYDWSTGYLWSDRAKYDFGWGALVECNPGTPTGSVHMLNQAWYPLIK